MAEENQDRLEWMKAHPHSWGIEDREFIIQEVERLRMDVMSGLAQGEVDAKEIDSLTKERDALTKQCDDWQEANAELKKKVEELKEEAKRWSYDMGQRMDEIAELKKKVEELKGQYRHTDFGRGV